jgi:hypothetical protein
LKEKIHAVSYELVIKFIYIYKVQFTLEKATRAQMGSRGTAVLSDETSPLCRIEL